MIQFYYNQRIKIRRNQRRDAQSNLGESKCGVSMSSLCGFRTHYPPGILMCDQMQTIAAQGCSPKLQCSELLIEAPLCKYD